MRQYDDFMKKVQRDPYTALFGRSWMNFGGESTEPKVAKTSSQDIPKATSLPKNERDREKSSSKSKSSSTKVPEEKDIGGRHSKSWTIPVQEHYQEYVIDPITNRKVLKASSSSTSILGECKPQAKEGDKTFESSSKHWNFVSATPLDHRFIVMESAQVLSSSNPRSEGTPVKQHTTKEWLAKEGFRGPQEPKADAQPIRQDHNAKPNTTATKIESALDRHLSSKSANEKEKSDQPRLQYKPEENKTEDIDLLRPADVRASAGLRGNSPKETSADKQNRRKKLEESYESCSVDHSEAARNKLVQKREERPIRKDTATELRFGSWLKGTLQDAKPKRIEALKDTSAVRVTDSSDATNFNPESINKTSSSTSLSRNGAVSNSPNAVAPEAQAQVGDKASKLKAQIVPFKAKLDAMKADYDFLRHEWLTEIRLVKERAAKKEKEMKAQEIAKRAREIHEEEVKTQKVAMESMEMRSNDRTTNTAKTALGGSVGNDVAEQPPPRRLQSFFQGEGDMASNVHEFAGRERWYKRKAPHAMNAKDAEIDAKLQKVAKDRALIREIRGIYEDTYGTIDTKHRQPHVLSTPQVESRGSVAATAAADQQKPTVNPSPSTTAPKAVVHEAQKATKHIFYRILAYDSDTRRVTSVESTTLAPFSKEESLLPLDVLNRLSNPGKYLPYVVSLAAKGYVPVSGTTNLLVLKREVSPQSLAETEKTDTWTGTNPVFNSLDHLPIVPDTSISGRDSNDLTAKEDLDECRQAQSRGTNGELHKDERARNVEKGQMIMGKAVKRGPTGRDIFLRENQAFLKAQGQQSTSSTSRKHTSRDRVHRQETVFSGSPHGRWVGRSWLEGRWLDGRWLGGRWVDLVDTNAKSRKWSRRVAGRRRWTVTHVLMAGVVTVASCYFVGVACEMMY